MNRLRHPPRLICPCRISVMWITGLTVSASLLQAQEMEPRAYSNAPVGMNFAVLGYGYSTGDVLLDSASPIKDAEITTHGVALAYARSLDLFGDNGKFDVVLPYAWTEGSAVLAGQRNEGAVNGFGDPSVRCSWNFIGAPALTLPEFKNYSPDWIVGASLRMGVPLGQYDSDKMLNIGANRWFIKPELGASKAWHQWTFDLAVSTTFFTDNHDFRGQTKSQEPLYATQSHLVYSFPNGWWACLDWTYFRGGNTTVDGFSNNDEQSNSRAGMTLAVPVSAQHSIKLYGNKGTTARAGGDFTVGGIAWQYRWGGGL